MEVIKKELWKGKTEIVDADLSALIGISFLRYV
jgi:hypothetical protein